LGNAILIDGWIVYVGFYFSDNNLLIIIFLIFYMSVNLSRDGQILNKLYLKYNLKIQNSILYFVF